MILIMNQKTVWGILMTNESKKNSNFTATNVDGATLTDPLNVAE